MKISIAVGLTVVGALSFKKEPAQAAVGWLRERVTGRSNRFVQNEKSDTCPFDAVGAALEMQ